MTPCERLLEKQLNTQPSTMLAKMGALETHVVEACQLSSFTEQAEDDSTSLAGFYLVVVDEDQPKRALAYCRLIRSDESKDRNEFDSAKIFGSDQIISSHPNQCFLEIGPFVFLSSEKKHRSSGLLWQAIATYCQREKIDYVIGCLPFKGKYPALHALALSYLYHHYLAQPDLLAHAKHGVSMDIMPAEAIKPDVGFASLPPMLRYWLRHGAKVGDGVVVDRSLEEIKLFVIVPAKKVGLN